MITIRIKSVDDQQGKTKSFKKEQSCHRFIVKRIGTNAEMGSGYAVSADGIVTIEVEKGPAIARLYKAAVRRHREETKKKEERQAKKEKQLQQRIARIAKIAETDPTRAQMMLTMPIVKLQNLELKYVEHIDNDGNTVEKVVHDQVSLFKFKAFASASYYMKKAKDLQQKETERMLKRKNKGADKEAKKAERAKARKLAKAKKLKEELAALQAELDQQNEA